VPLHSGRAILRAAGAEAVAAKNWPTWLRFERHAVGLAALIANDLEPFSLCSRLTRTAKVGAARVAARFTTLRMAQATLAIIFLFPFTKRKSSSAFCARNLKVWHRYLPRKLFSVCLD
jgi:hypothetical protein